MKETLRIVMPWTGGCLGLLVLIFGVLAYLFDDGRQALCDKAVEKAMKDKASYVLLEVIEDEDEGPKEGRGISWFKYIYRYYAGSFELRVGALQCTYIDDGHDTVYISDQKQLEL